MSFKDQFKSAFEPSNEPWDKEEMWSDIEDLLPPKEKERRPVFWWIFGSVNVVLLLLATYQFMNNDSNLSIADATTSLNVKQESAFTTQDKIELKLDEEEMERNDLVDKKNATIDNTSKKFTKKDKAILSFDEESNSASSFNSNNLLNLPNEVDTENNYNDAKQASLVLNKSIMSMSSENGIEKELDGIKEVTLVDVQDSKERITINLLPVSLRLLPQNERPLIDVNKTFSLSEESKMKTGYKYEWSVQLGAGVTNQKIEATNNVLDAYVDIHNSSKSLKESINIHGMFRSRLGNGLSIGLGLAYHRSFEWYDAVLLTTNTENIPSDSSKFYVVNGFQQFVAGEISETRIERRNYHSPVYRHSIDLPIEIGYLLGSGRFSCFNSIAFNNNVSYSYQGRVYNTSGELLSKDVEKDQFFRSKWVNSMTLGTELRYNYSKGYSLGLGLKYRNQLSSTFVKALELDEKYNALMLTVSLNRRW